MKNAAIILFAIGLLLTIYTSFNLVTREKVVDIGKVEISADKNNYFAWSPILGIAVMALGGSLFFFGTKKTNLKRLTISNLLKQMIMYEILREENKDFKIAGNWEVFAKRLQEKFWIDLKEKLAHDKSNKFNKAL